MKGSTLLREPATPDCLLAARLDGVRALELALDEFSLLLSLDPAAELLELCSLRRLPINGDISLPSCGEGGLATGIWPETGDGGLATGACPSIPSSFGTFRDDWAGFDGFI